MAHYNSEVPKNEAISLKDWMIETIFDAETERVQRIASQIAINIDEEISQYTKIPDEKKDSLDSPPVHVTYITEFEKRKFDGMGDYIEAYNKQPEKRDFYYNETLESFQRYIDLEPMFSELNKRHADTDKLAGGFHAELNNISEIMTQVMQDSYCGYYDMVSRDSLLNIYPRETGEISTYNGFGANIAFAGRDTEGKAVQKSLTKKASSHFESVAKKEFSSDSPHVTVGKVVKDHGFPVPTAHGVALSMTDVPQKIVKDGVESEVVGYYGIMDMRLGFFAGVIVRNGKGECEPLHLRYFQNPLSFIPSPKEVVAKLSKEKGSAVGAHELMDLIPKSLLSDNPVFPLENLLWGRIASSIIEESIESYQYYNYEPMHALPKLREYLYEEISKFAEHDSEIKDMVEEYGFKSDMDANDFVDFVATILGENSGNPVKSPESISSYDVRDEDRENMAQYMAHLTSINSQIGYRIVGLDNAFASRLDESDVAIMLSDIVSTMASI
jgi:hypothetical protein